ncbi:MAG: PAC2 family protein [Thaumarchaeota archaeon]|nr:PAC2 family protein [Candidatus Calditenuaceae archaeon]MDW8186879.1 PAC2 family protein [Nitrososphaerota archaeon]
MELVEDYGEVVKGKKVLLDLSPGPGAVGMILANLLLELKEVKRVKSVFSPHFPQVCLIDNEGLSSLPKVEVYQREDSVNAIVVVRNFVVDSTEAGESVSERLVKELRVTQDDLLIVITSGRLTGAGDIFVASTDQELLRSAVAVGAKMAPHMDALPVDRLSSALLRRCVVGGAKAMFVVVDTEALMPDFKAAKKLVQLLSSLLGIQITTTRLDEEAAKQQRFLQQMERTMRGMLEPGEEEERKPSYIG